jgi:metal-responsive CopG/Arc/MetJ family transcriptional regulator
VAKLKEDSKNFIVRETIDELEKLDKAIRKLGYKDRADWYRDMKRQK